MSLRTIENEDKYQAKLKQLDGHQLDNFNFDPTTKLIYDYKYWALIENDFPYDLIATADHLLVPKRIFSKAINMNNEEYQELVMIKEELSAKYDSVLENLGTNVTIKNHFHLHFLKFKE